MWRASQDMTSSFKGNRIFFSSWRTFREIRKVCRAWARPLRLSKTSRPHVTWPVSSSQKQFPSAWKPVTPRVFHLRRASARAAGPSGAAERTNERARSPRRLGIGRIARASLPNSGQTCRGAAGIGAPTAPESRERVRGLARSRGGVTGGDGGDWRWGGGGDLRLWGRESRVSGFFIRYFKCRWEAVVSAVFTGGRGGRSGGRRGAEVRGWPAAARCGGLNQQVPASGWGRRGRAHPLPHARARAGPRAASRAAPGSGSPAGSGGCPLNLCPSEERCLAVPAPSAWLTTHHGASPARPARGAGRRLSSAAAPRGSQLSGLAPGRVRDRGGAKNTFLW